jgi:hypothetical protein
MVNQAWSFEVGGIPLTDFSAGEVMKDLGAYLDAAIIDYPGGLRSAQVFGYHLPPIEWTGRFFGGTSLQAALQLKQLCTNGQQINFTFGQFQFQGLLKTFNLDVQSQNEIIYSAKFVVINDQTSASSFPTTSNFPSTTSANNSTAGNAINAAQGQSNGGGPNGTLPQSVQQGVSNLANSVSQAFSGANGNVGQIDPVTAAGIQAQIASLVSILTPLTNGTNPQAASDAGTLQATLSALSDSFTQSQAQQIKTINVINPNLFALAAAFYEDPSKWILIAEANGLTGPLPAGSFPNLIIPVDNTAPNEPPTVM